MSPMIMSVFLVVVAVATVVSGATYTPKVDNINVDDVTKDDRLRKNAVSCLLNNKSCTPEVRELKKFLPDALTNNCASCTEKQREGATKALKTLLEDYSEDNKKLAVTCLLNNNSCTPEVRELKKFLPDALKNNCASCTEKQREGVTKALKTLIEDYSEDFKKLADKYDP